jgi:hypothetical protein
MGVSGQRHVPAALLPPGKGPPVPIVQEAGWAPEPVWTQRIQEKSYAPAGDRTPIVQPVVRHYTAWANPAPPTKYAKLQIILVEHVCSLGVYVRNLVTTSALFLNQTSCRYRLYYRRFGDLTVSVLKTTSLRRRQDLYVVQVPVNRIRINTNLTW